MEERHRDQFTATFNNHQSVKNQAVNQTFHGAVFFGQDQYQQQNLLSSTGLSQTDLNVLGSLAFPEMLDRRNDVEMPHADTCQWILDLEEYKHWISQPTGFLWIKGKPGAGKSTLMAYLYRRLRNDHAITDQIYLEFFFSARGSELQRTPPGMLRSLLNQLYCQVPDIRAAVSECYQDKCMSFGTTRWEWQQQELETLLQAAILTCSQSVPLTIFVDALDEAGPKSAAHLVRYFHRINGILAKSNALGKICISCRHYPVISIAQGTEVSVENYNRDDIAAFIHDSLQVDQLFDTSSPEYGEWQTFKRDLVTAAGGIFQWASLVLPLVEQKIVDGECLEKVRRWLQRVPDELGTVYRYILQNVIQAAYHPQSFLLFQWVCLAERPLSVAEMRYAMAASDTVTSTHRIHCHETEHFVKTDELMKRRVRALSGGLVEVVMNESGDKEIIQIIHQSVRNFLLVQGLSLLTTLATSEHKSHLNSDDVISQCHLTLHQSCLNFLLVEPMHFTRSNKTEPESLLEQFPFARYALKNVLTHGRKGIKMTRSNPRQDIRLLQELLPNWTLSSCSSRR